MDLSHDNLVFVAKTFGLIYLVILSIVVVCYACRPSRRKEFEDASTAILTREDRPCR